MQEQFETHLFQQEGQDFDAILAAYEKAKNATSGRPQFIELKTTIAKGIPEVAGTNKVFFLH
jgi:transketolase